MALFDRLRAEPVYNTRAVVQRTGVPADTIRAWERRYGLPEPARTEGNQRLYSERDVATIAWLRDQTRAGLSISHAVQLFRSNQLVPAGGPDTSDARPDAGVRAPIFPAVEQSPVAAPGAREDHLQRFQDDLVQALVDYDATAASHTVEQALVLLPLEDVCLHLLQPALYEIGRRWAAGEVGVSVEHFASAFVIRKLGALFNLSQPEHGRGPILAACLAGELHEVGLLLTCLFLSRRGFRILYLGPNLPLEDLIQTSRKLRPALILLSASTPEAASDLAAASHELRARIGAECAGHAPRIGFGGLAFIDHPELRRGVDGLFLGRNADEAIAAVEQAMPLPVGST